MRIIRHKENLRQGGARNTGISAAKGDWVIFLDIDDYWVRKDVFDTFERVLGNNDKVEIIECNGYYTDIQQTINHKVFDEEDLTIVTPLEYYSSSHHPCIWTSCYKRTLIANIKFREHVYYEDTDWKIRTYLKVSQIALIDYKFYLYYQNPMSTTQIYSPKLFEDGVIANKICKNLFKGLNFTPEVKHKRLVDSKRINFNLLMTVRNYPIKEGKRLIKAQLQSGIFNGLDNVLNFKDRIMLFMCKASPLFMAILLRYAVLIKRKLK